MKSGSPDERSLSIVWFGGAVDRRIGVSWFSHFVGLSVHFRVTCPKIPAKRERVILRNHILRICLLYFLIQSGSFQGGYDTCWHRWRCSYPHQLRCVLNSIRYFCNRDTANFFRRSISGWEHMEGPASCFWCSQCRPHVTAFRQWPVRVIGRLLPCRLQIHPKFLHVMLFSENKRILTLLPIPLAVDDVIPFNRRRWDYRSI